MKVSQLITLLQAAPQNYNVVVASMGFGDIVHVEGLEQNYLGTVEIVFGEQDGTQAPSENPLIN